MRFIQQPTATLVNEPFDPPITVQISDGQPDTLIIFGNSGTCTVTSQTVTADATGLATFSGLIAGATPGVGCTLTVHNLTRPEIADIVSDPFDVSQAKGIITVLDFVCSVPNTTSISNSVRSINTAGANLILVLSFSDIMGELFEYVAATGDQTANIFTAATIAALPTGGAPLILWWSSPVQTGVVSYRMFGTNGYFGFAVLALSGWNGQPPTVYDGVSLVATAPPNNQTTVLPQPLPTGLDNFIATFMGTYQANPAFPFPYADFDYGPPTSGLSYRPSISWKMGTSAFENPVWSWVATFTSGIQIGVSAVMIEPALL